MLSETRELWRIGLGWDEIMPPESSDVVSDWVRGLEVLKRFEIPRTYILQLRLEWRGGRVSSRLWRRLPEGILLKG